MKNELTLSGPETQLILVRLIKDFHASQHTSAIHKFCNSDYFPKRYRTSLVNWLSKYKTGLKAKIAEDSSVKIKAYRSAKNTSYNKDIETYCFYRPGSKFSSIENISENQKLRNILHEFLVCNKADNQKEDQRENKAKLIQSKSLSLKTQKNLLDFAENCHDEQAISILKAFILNSSVQNYFGDEVQEIMNAIDKRIDL